MKLTIFLFIILLFTTSKIYSEDEAIVIKMKSGASDIIPLKEIKKITFELVSDIIINKISTNTLIAKGNFPNPFNEQTTIEFEIASAGIVEIYIYNSYGELVQNLKCENCLEGNNIIHWDCKDKNNIKVPSGVYFYEIRFGNNIQSKKMIIVR